MVCRHLCRPILRAARHSTPPAWLTKSAKTPKVSVISESGLYKLVMRSEKAEGTTLQAWVTETVFPANREDDGYFCENCVSVFDRECLWKIPPVPPAVL